MMYVTIHADNKKYEAAEPQVQNDTQKKKKKRVTFGTIFILKTDKQMKSSKPLSNSSINGSSVG